MCIASLVLGICSLVIPFVGVIASIVGLILGIIGRNKAKEFRAPTGMATAGIVMSIIGFVGAIITVVAFTAIISLIATNPDTWYYYY